MVSDNDRETDIATKVADWLEAGGGRVWEVRPRTQTITVHRPGHLQRTLGMRDTLGSDDAGFSVEGFALPVAAIFDRDMETDAPTGRPGAR